MDKYFIRTLVEWMHYLFTLPQKKCYFPGHLLGHYIYYIALRIYKNEVVLNG